MTQKELVIFGAGAHAKVVIDLALCEGTYKPISIFDETGQAAGELLGVPIASTQEVLRPGYFIVAVGDNKARKRIFENLLNHGWEPATLIHPAAVVSKFARVGQGSVICRLASLCVDAIVEQNVIINTSSTVPHDAIVEAHAHVSAGCHFGGGTKIRSGALLGVGSCTRPGIEIGAWATIGAGTTIVSDVPDGVTVVGSPTRVLASEGRSI